MKASGITLDQLKCSREITLRQQIYLVSMLSIPSILAELSSLLMTLIDSAMVGALGANATASIGLVSTCVWTFGGLSMAMASGFSVQIAQLIGANRDSDARNVVRQSFVAAAAFGAFLTLIGTALSPFLPGWLGGAQEIRTQSTHYFFIYCCALLPSLFRILSSSILQCSGDMRTPGVMNVLMCVFDVLFNFLLIFPNRTLTVWSISFTMPGAGLGVAGAALGTGLAESVAACCLIWVLCTRSERLQFSKGGSWRLEGNTLRAAAKISLPMALERTVLRAAQITTTILISPLGVVSIAANTLAVSAEGLCYMPAYGIAAAATTLVGQSLGAEKPDYARRFARISSWMGMILMAFMGALMYVCAPFIFRLLTPDLEVRALGSLVLRIEAFAEPLFAASIIICGALRGAGDTLVPSILNLVSIWGFRITGALLLIPHMGLSGMWLSMCIELCIRGVLFLIRLYREKWLKYKLISDL